MLSSKQLARQRSWWFLHWPRQEFDVGSSKWWIDLKNPAWCRRFIDGSIWRKTTVALDFLIYYLITASIEFHLVDRGILFIIYISAVQLMMHLYRRWKMITKPVILLLHMGLLCHIFWRRSWVWLTLALHFCESWSCIACLLKLNYLLRLLLLLSSNPSLGLWVQKCALHCRIV